MGQRSLMVAAKRPARRFRSGGFTVRSAAGHSPGVRDFWYSAAGMLASLINWRFKTGRTIRSHKGLGGGFCLLRRVRHFFAGCELGLANYWLESAKNWTPTGCSRRWWMTNG
jgi:hypothetical protein